MDVFFVYLEHAGITINGYHAAMPLFSPRLVGEKFSRYIVIKLQILLFFHGAINFTGTANSMR